MRIPARSRALARAYRNAPSRPRRNWQRGCRGRGGSSGKLPVQIGHSRRRERSGARGNQLLQLNQFLIIRLGRVPLPPFGTTFQFFPGAGYIDFDCVVVHEPAVDNQISTTIISVVIRDCESACVMWILPAHIIDSRIVPVDYSPSISIRGQRVTVDNARFTTEGIVNDHRPDDRHVANTDADQPAMARRAGALMEEKHGLGRPLRLQSRHKPSPIIHRAHARIYGAKAIGTVTTSRINASIRARVRAPGLGPGDLAGHRLKIGAQSGEPTLGGGAPDRRPVPPCDRTERDGDH